jgi:hypothetical protein
MGIQINGNTNNINAGIGSLSIEDINELDIAGVATAANFKTGVSNLHSLGLTLSGGQLDVGSNIKLGTAGVVTATSFVGSGANLTGISNVQIGGNVNNRLLTCDGTSTLVGEPNLSFDGNHLEFANGKGIRTNYIRPTSSGNTNTGGAAQQYWKLGEISLNGSEAAEITLLGANGYSAGNNEVYGKTTIVLRGSNGNTLLGSWWVDGGQGAHYADVRWKHISGTNYELWVSAGNFNNIAPFVRATGTFDQTNAAGTGSNTAPSGSTALPQTHYKTVGSINTIQYTNTHTRYLRNIKMDNGYGIDFSANTSEGGTSTATLLDDYEEGSYTITSNANLTLDNTRTGYYTKIGNMVNVIGYLSLNTNNGSPSVSGTDNIVLSLPYARDTGMPSYTGTILQQNIDSDTPTSLVGHPRWYKDLPVDYVCMAASNGLRFYINRIEAAYVRMNNSHLHVGYPGYTYIVWNITYRTN